MKKGLSENEAKKRLLEYGENEIVEKKESNFLIFLRQFKSPLIVILIVACIISFLIGEILDSVVIIGIVILNSIIGFYQERKAEKAIESLKKLTAPTAVVVRDGKIKTIPASKLVPGDLVIFDAGKKIPADCKILKSNNLEVDESLLTGESIPVRKEDGDKIFSGTTVTYGRCEAIVTETGMNTEIGKISKMVDVQKKTILQERLEILSKQLGIIIIGICAIIFLVGFLRRMEFLEIFLISIALAVAAIPEGLPVITTITLALGVQRMAKKNAIVRRLPSVETLGCTNVICTDKTGTLTQNKMKLTMFYTNDNFVGVDDENCDGYTKENIRLLLKIGALCNDSNIEQIGNETKIIGNPMEGALKIVATKLGINFSEERVDELPFDSKRKCMTTIHKSSNGYFVCTKGAPEIIIEKCKFVLKNGKIFQINKKEILDANQKMAEDMRVIGFAYRKIKNYNKKIGIENIEKDMIFIGFAAFIDPPRPEVKKAIEDCRRAGIKVVMITGDQKNTAIHIGKELGLYEGLVLTGEEIDKYNDEEFSKIVDNVSIYARVFPEHKLRIINALKNKNYVTAMIGDGINDAPALRKSDIGVSVGSGTDVAKESSDIVLADDNFATIVHAVEEGRGIYDNIKKTINFLLSTNIAEIAVIFLALLLGFPTPLLPIQILWINMVTDSFPAIALGVDPFKDMMNKKPRDKKEKILTKKSLRFIGIVGFVIAIIALALFNFDGNLNHARTMAFTSIVILEMVVALILSNFFKNNGELNKKLILAIATAILLQIAIIYLPFFNSIFSTVPLSLADWTLIAIISAIMLVCAWFMKKFY